VLIPPALMQNQLPGGSAFIANKPDLRINSFWRKNHDRFPEYLNLRLTRCLSEKAIALAGDF